MSVCFSGSLPAYSCIQPLLSLFVLCRAVEYNMMMMMIVPAMSIKHFSVLQTAWRSNGYTGFQLSPQHQLLCNQILREETVGLLPFIGESTYWTSLAAVLVLLVLLMARRYTLIQHRSQVLRQYAHYAALLFYFILFIYFKSTTEGPEGLLYCQKYTQLHKYTQYGKVKKEKKRKNNMKHILHTLLYSAILA